MECKNDKHKIVPLWAWIYCKNFSRVIEGKNHYVYCEKCGKIFGSKYDLAKD